MEKDKAKRLFGLRKADWCLIFVMVLVGVALLGARYLTRSQGNSLLIQVDGKEYKTLPLSRDTELTITLEDGSTNTVTIEGGYAYMKDADCPDKLCVHMAKIKYSGETVTCLPHKVVLQVIGEETGEIDAKVQ